MTLLLDTHIFLWLISGDSRLPAKMLAAIQDPRNGVFLSVASVWECVVKHALGKLPLPEAPGQYIPTQRARHAVASLPLDELSVTLLSGLPPIHRDPFDRILVCQARQHGMRLLTVDAEVLAYGVPGLP